MSDTPQTDAFENLGFLDQQMNWWDFARQLERELAAKEKEIASLRAQLAAAKQQLDMPHRANAMLCECERELAFTHK